MENYDKFSYQIDDIKYLEKKDIGRDDYPFTPIGLFTYLRTYARKHEFDNHESTIENWGESVERVIDSAKNQLKINFSHLEECELRYLLFNLKFSVAGRFLWQLGTKTVDRLGLMSLMNCCFIVIDEPVKPFCWLFNFLMLGAGVGFRILPTDIEKLPYVKNVVIKRSDTKDADFIVPDSREGWVKLLGRVLKAYFVTGKSFTYSLLLLRSKGALIKSFGGLASGPDVLEDGMNDIKDLLDKRIGNKIRPIDALDICNIIGRVTVSGNVRRSAQIALGDVNDIEYLKAKDWSSGNIPNYRAHSNNSVICNDINDVLDNESFWEGYQGHGEPYGLINLNLMRKCGRLGETQYPDPSVEGTNPCAEQSLSNGETCCLSDIFLPRIVSKNELFRTSIYAYKLCKHSLMLKCGQSAMTEKVVGKNMRLGVGATGILQSTEEQKSWLSDCYEYLREFDKKYSKEIGVNTSVKLTTVKPSGCSRRDMLIYTDEGLLRLDEIGNVNASEERQKINHTVLTSNGNYKKATEFYNNGFVPTKIIKFEKSGISVESSLNHKYMTNSGVWKTVEQLEVGDKIKVVRNYYKKQEPFVFVKVEGLDSPSTSTPELSKFIGFLYMCCFVDNIGNKIGFYNNNTDSTKMFVKEVDRLFGIRDFEIKNRHLIIACGEQIALLIKWLNLNKLLSSTFCAIRRFPRNCMKEFVDFLKKRETNFLSNTERNYFNVMRLAVEESDDDFLEISSVTDNACNTYDISVEEEHQYILNGLVSHNTLSILGNTTPGVHPGFSRFYKRRIRIDSRSPLTAMMAKNGFHVEYAMNFDGTENRDTKIISFPCKFSENTKLAKDCTAVDQLNYVKEMQRVWSDNSVSVTVYYKKEELPEIKQWLKENYNDCVKSVSFLLHSGHGFQQAPYEEITEEEYEEMMRTCNHNIKLENICYFKEKEENLAQQECQSGMCPIR